MATSLADEQLGPLLDRWKVRRILSEGEWKPIKINVNVKAPEKK